MEYKIYHDKRISPAEFGELMVSVGWGSNYDSAAIERSIAAYPFVSYARDSAGKLIGYVSAFSDRAFSTMLGELVVSLPAQGNGIGRSLLNAVEEEFRGVPIYVKPLGRAKKFFLACGYRTPSAEMCVLFKGNALPANTVLDTGANAPVN
jgi:GNAT superfamily N-acetyltransferase